MTRRKPLHTKEYLTFHSKALREQGHSYAQIGKLLGIGSARAWQLVSGWYEKQVQARQPAVQAKRAAREEKLGQAAALVAQGVSVRKAAAQVGKTPRAISAYLRQHKITKGGPVEVPKSREFSEVSAVFKQQVLALLDEGYSQSAVARAAGCTRQYVSLLAREDRRRVTLTPLGELVVSAIDLLGDNEAFLEALENPPPPTDALKAAFERYNQNGKSSS